MPKIGGARAPTERRCNHTGEESVEVGTYMIRAGGRFYLKPAHFRSVTVLVALNSWVHPVVERSGVHEVIDLGLPDFGGVPEDWRQKLDVEIIPRLERGDAMMAYCTASHGRTGTFLASLIALLESDEETPDPIAAVRKRHCSHAVETMAQAKAIFALRGKEVPERYIGTFRC